MKVAVRTSPLAPCDDRSSAPPKASSVHKRIGPLATRVSFRIVIAPLGTTTVQQSVGSIPPKTSAV